MRCQLRGKRVYFLVYNHSRLSEGLGIFTIWGAQGVHCNTSFKFNAFEYLCVMYRGAHVATQTAYETLTPQNFAHITKLKALSQFPGPTNISELKSFMGLVEQSAGFSTEVAGAKEPLRPLLSTRNPYVWTPDHDRAFAAVNPLSAATKPMGRID